MKSKTGLKNFSTRIKFLEDLESDLNIFFFKLNDIYFMFEELLHTKVPADILELQKSKGYRDQTFKSRFVFLYALIIVQVVL